MITTALMENVEKMMKQRIKIEMLVSVSMKMKYAMVEGSAVIVTVAGIIQTIIQTMMKIIAVFVLLSVNVMNAQFRFIL
ncbi:MAG: hypothetical protein EZS28_002224 [Streblomastix strix]|uniref:Uncharacterized protein n=1 Tax=Streblomastix strix TaxID=222440 RepID=A0A5J4X4T3_9EUKA|nr:MAG: hypothetical protein EZS28_002224 [Streblomastix strix]